MKAAAVLAVAVLVSAGLSGAQRASDLVTVTPLDDNAALVIGFMGGREAWNNDRRGVRKLALTLRAMNLPGVHVETIENTKREIALDLVRRAFDRNGDGRLDDRERAGSKVIVYGQSFGGAAVVKFARQLQALDVPIALTVQVDSVGWGDAIIPANVARALNLYQRDGFTVRGEPEIRAEDPSRTMILGNLRYTYADKEVDLSDVTWLKRTLQRAHTKMDHDPEVWAEVESAVMRTLADICAGREQGAHCWCQNPSNREVLHAFPRASRP